MQLLGLDVEHANQLRNFSTGSVPPGSSLFFEVWHRNKTIFKDETRWQIKDQFEVRVLICIFRFCSPLLQQDLVRTFLFVPGRTYIRRPSEFMAHLKRVAIDASLEKSQARLKYFNK